jgi:SnoaL-like domain
MSDVITTVDTYLAMWNEADPTRRAEHIARAWTDDGRYVDPMLEAEGHAAMSGMVVGVQERFPGHRFRRVSGVDTHHGEVRFAWELVAPDGAVVVAGIDVGGLAADGRLRRITGFFGELPKQAEAGR